MGGRCSRRHGGCRCSHTCRRPATRTAKRRWWRCHGWWLCHRNRLAWLDERSCCRRGSCGGRRRRRGSCGGRWHRPRACGSWRRRRRACGSWRRRRRACGSWWRRRRLCSGRRRLGRFGRRRLRLTFFGLGLRDHDPRCRFRVHRLNQQHQRRNDCPSEQRSRDLHHSVPCLQGNHNDRMSRAFKRDSSQQDSSERVHWRRGSQTSS